MMKKLPILLIVTVFVLGGCNNAINSENSDTSTSSVNNVSETTWDRDGLSFSYPSNIVASYGESGNIQVFKAMTFSDYANVCGGDITKMDYEEWKNMDDRVQRVLVGLKELKNNGVNVDNVKTILDIDNDGCFWTAGNMKAEPIKVSGLNGAIFERCECQDYGELNSLYTTLVFVNQYDELHEIRFRYNFGNFASGIPDKPVSESDWDSVFNFLKDGTPIKITWLKGYMDNREIIDKIIKTVKVTK
jgi:hypothetical protein